MNSGKLSLEKEVMQYLKNANIQFEEAVYSYDDLDFVLFSRHGRRKFYLEAKEKMRPIKTRNWPETGIPERYLFILDDLTARKVLKVAPNSGIVVRDNTSFKYFFYSVVDLYLMPKLRVNRPIMKNVYTLKGKWMIDLRNGKAFKDFDEVIQGIVQYQSSFDRIFQNEIRAYGSYVGETLPIGGTIRQHKAWSEDFKSTR